MEHVIPKMRNINQLPLVFTADGFPITADLGAFLWCMSQGGAVRLSKNIDLYRILMGGHIKESDPSVHKYAQMFNNCVRVWDNNPNISIFKVQVGVSLQKGMRLHQLCFLTQIV